MGFAEDLIRFSDPDEWEQIFSQTYTAERISENAFVPIGQQDLGVSISEIFVVVVATPITGRPTWRFSGTVRQAYDFPTGGEVSGAFGTAQGTPVDVLSRQPQIIRLQQARSGQFRLLYEPPPWFEDAFIAGWRYIGEIENIAESQIEDITRVLGVSPIDTPGNILDEFSDIETRFDELTTQTTTILESINNLVSQSTDSTELESQFQQQNALLTEQNNQLQQTLNTVVNQVNQLLPPDQQVDVGSNNTPTNLEDEFT